MKKLIPTLTLIFSSILSFSQAEIIVTRDGQEVTMNSTYNYGDQMINTYSDSIEYWVYNTGDTDLVLMGSPWASLGGVAASSYGTQLYNILTTIAPGDSSGFLLYFYPTSTGAKNATITIINSDNDEGAFFINLRGTGIPNTIGLPESAGQSLKAYPNPFSESIRIDSDHGSVEDIQLFNLNGQRVLRSKHTEINTSSVPAGTYFLRVLSNERSTTIPMIKK